MSLTVIIVSWNTKDLLQACLVSLFAELERLSVEASVFVVDNNSHDGSAAMVRAAFPRVYLIANADNRGFGAANNQVLTTHSSDYYVLLNPDTEVVPGAIGALMAFASAHRQAGIIAPQLLNTDHTIQRSCRRFPSIKSMTLALLGVQGSSVTENDYLMRDFDHTYARQVDQPEGACLLIPKTVLDAVGVFDEQFYMLFEEVDLCYRVKQAGWEIWFTPDAKIIHHYGQSIKQVKARMIYYSHRGFFRYMSKHLRVWWFQWLRPLWYVGLMGLSILRMVQSYVKRLV